MKHAEDTCSQKYLASDYEETEGDKEMVLDQKVFRIMKTFQEVEGVWSVDTDYWRNKENRKKAYIYAEKTLGIKTPEDWYKIKAGDLKNIGLRFMLTNEYGDSWTKFPMEFNPNFEFVQWKFSSVPNGFWKKPDNLRKYFEWLASIKGFTSMDGFYSLKASDLINNAGSGIISQKPHKSIIELLKSAFPEYNWIEWKFVRVANCFWESKANQRTYLLWLFKELRLKFPDDAMELQKKHFVSNYGGTLIYDQTTTEVLQNAFETYDWVSIIQKNKPRHETLATYVSDLCAHPSLKFSRILHYMVRENLSINCFVPELKLGFQLVKSLDQWESIRNSVICQTEGIKLVQLPEGLVITKKLIKKIITTVNGRPEELKINRMILE